jgi:hypothetical protein
MASDINPESIDENYPVAGVPNNTQGFRDNFSATKTNFDFARNEINELQSKTVLKSALTGQSLDNNMLDNLLYAARIQDFSGTIVEIPTTSGSISVDYSAAHFQTIGPTTGSIGISFTNFPATGTVGFMRIQFTINNIAHTLTLPAAVSVGTTGIQGYSANVITFAATGTYEFGFLSYDGGETITVFDLNRPLSTFTNTVTISATTASTSSTTGALIVAGGVGVAGNINSAGSIRSVSTSAGIGYGTGAGGTISQDTDKSTSVELNRICGRITMNSATLNAGDEVSFTLTNSAIAATDVVAVCIASGATAGAYNVQVDAVGAGSCRISVGNVSAGNLGEAIVLNFVVIKSVTA